MVSNRVSSCKLVIRGERVVLKIFSFDTLFDQTCCTLRVEVIGFGGFTYRVKTKL